MTQAIKWLRISFWAGAIVDALAAIQMLSPRAFALTNRLANFDPPPAYRFAMGMGASLMFGWTFLLIWADRRPMERKGVLLLTIIPVLVGLVANEIWAVMEKFISIEALAPVLLLQTGLTALFAFSYWNASAVADHVFPFE